MQTLIAEDLLLLLLDDAKGTLAASDKIQPLLGGALLLELALAGRVGVAERTSRWTLGQGRRRRARHPASRCSTRRWPGWPRSRGPPRTCQPARQGHPGRAARPPRRARASSSGATARCSGCFPRTTWPARDARHEESVRALLQGALVQGAHARRRAPSALVALLAAIDQRPQGRRPRATCRPGRSRPRAKEIADGAWAAKAVRDAVVAAQAAITAAVTASVAATTAGSS